MISTGAFLNEMDASDKQTMAEKFATVWEKKNAKAARAGGVSLMALSLAACGGSSSTTTTTTTPVEPTTPAVDAAKSIALTTSTDGAVGGSGDDSFSGTVQAQGGTGTTAMAGDTVDGGAGSDTFTLTLAGAHTGPYTVAALDVDNVESYLVNNFETSGNDTTIDTTLNSGVTLYGLASSNATGDTVFDNVASVTDAAMKNGAGDLTLTYLAAATTGTADVQNLAVANTTAGTFTANGTETIAITTSLAKSTLANVASDALTKVTVAGDQNLTISNAIDFVAGTNNDTTIDATIDASGLTGKLNVTADQNDHSITGGSGDDTINMVGLLTKNDHIDGGAGADTLTLDQAALTTEFTNVSNIETVRFNVDDSSTAAVAYDLSKLSDGVTTVAIDVNDNANAARDHTINKHTSETIVIRNSADDDAAVDTEVVINNATDTAADVLNVTLIETQEGSNKTDLETLNAANYETVNINSSKEATTTASVTNNVDSLSVASATTVNVSGNSALTIDSITGGAMTAFDASGLAGKLTATFASTDKVTATAAQKDTTFAFGSTLDNNDTVVGGAGSKDVVTATLTGATATTGALKISDVETVTLTTSGNNTLNLAGITNANTIAVSANTQTITGYDLGATLRLSDAATVKLTAADASGSDDTLKVQHYADGDKDNTIEVDGIETLSIDLYDTGATANTAGFDLDKFTGTKIVASNNAASSTNVNFDLAGTTLYKTISSVDLTGVKGTATVTAANATQSVTFDLGGTGAANATGGAYADTFNIASTTAAHTVSGGGGADVVNITTAGATDVSNIDAETVNLNVSAGTAADVSGGTFHSGVDAVVVTGGNSLSTFTTGTIHDNVKSVNASAFGGKSVMTLGDDTADTTVSLTGGANAKDSLAFQLSGTNFTATTTGIETLSGDIDGDDTVNLNNTSGVTLVSLDIANGKTATVSNVTDEVVRVTHGNAAAQVTVSLKNALGSADTATVELKDAATNLAAGFNIGTSDIETVTIKASSAESVDLSTLAMTAAGSVMTVNVTGDSALTVSALNADVTTVNASGMEDGGSFVQTGRSATAASTYTGSAGNDTIIMMNAQDVLDAGAGTGDTLDINFNAVLGGINVDLSSTGDQVTSFNGMAEATVQKGFDHVDVAGYTGGSGASITGSATANTIVGTGVVDQIDGGAGDDTITGGAGNDVMTGGTGADTFKILATGDSDTITDYVGGTDIISLTQSGVFALDTTDSDVADANEYLEISSANGGTFTLNAANDVIVLTDTTGFTVAQVGDSLDTGVAADDAIVVFYNSGTSKVNVLYDADLDDTTDGTVFLVLDNFAAADLADFAATSFVLA